MGKYKVSNITFNGDNNHVGDKFVNAETYIEELNIISEDGKVFVEELFNSKVKESDKQEYLNHFQEVTQSKKIKSEEQLSALKSMIIKLKEKSLDLAVDSFLKYLGGLNKDILIALSENPEINQYINSLGIF